MKIKRGDTILVISGKDRGKTGKVTRIFPDELKATVEGLNMYKRHLRPSRRNPHGGIIDIARPLPISNIALICPRCNKPSRIGYKITEKGKLRICKQCSESVGEE